MKKTSLLIILLFSFYFSNGQTAAKQPKLDENAIVKDENGSVYPYAIWKKLLETGQYSAKLVARNDGVAPEFQLYRMTAEQMEVYKKRRAEMLAKLPQPLSSEAFTDGQKFKFEKMKDLSGNKYDFKTDTGKVVVFNFWFINCPPCKKEIPELNDLVEKYKENPNVKFIAIALDDSYSLKNFLKLSPFNYNIVPDGRYFSDKYDIKGYPTHVVVGKDGTVKFSTMGLASNTVYWVDKVIKEQL